MVGTLLMPLVCDKCSKPVFGYKHGLIVFLWDCVGDDVFVTCVYPTWCNCHVCLVLGGIRIVLCAGLQTWGLLWYWQCIFAMGKAAFVDHQTVALCDFAFMTAFTLVFHYYKCCACSKARVLALMALHKCGKRMSLHLAALGKTYTQGRCGRSLLISCKPPNLVHLPTQHSGQRVW